MFILKKKKFVIVAMSGGVDSTVSAFLLKKMGYHVEGVFMKNWIKDDNDDYCNSEEDFLYARLVSKKLNIKLHTVNFSKEYWNRVFKIILSQYKKGITPNPDILCNKEIKFNEFIKYSKNILGSDYIATGHYVRNIFNKKNNILLKSIDKNRDQSYFLYTLNSINIKLCLFPIGWLYKENVRKIAKNLNLENYDKKSSTGICFIGKRNFRKFIKRFIPENKGNIIDTCGNKIGIHEGLHFYTLGQRTGLKIGGIKGYLSLPWYVVDKNIKYNNLIVSQDLKHKNLLSIGLIAKSIHWINDIYNINNLNISVRIRNSKSDILCKISLLDKNKLLVLFKHKTGIVVPGQSVVFYKNEICLGGGIIKCNIK